MKKYARLISYLRDNTGKIVLYFVFSVLSILFSLVSFGALPFFLKIIFTPDKMDPQKPSGPFDVLNYINYELSLFIREHGSNGPMLALAYICLIVIVSVFLKNLFFYLSFYVLSPLKNSVVARLRNDLYSKLLQLPIGFFTDQRKGDVMSRMTNDIAEIETSVVGTLEGLIKDPLNVIVILLVLVWISPRLSLFLLVFLPVTGFIIGRVSRSLKKQSNISAVKLGEVLSVLDETLTGLRVIKAFNAERILRKKFKVTNDALFYIRNKMQIRRDLASPLSEFLGVLVLTGVLWIGGKLVLANQAGGLSAVGFIMYIGLFTQIINPAKSLSTSFYNIQRGTAAILRIEEILQTPVKVDENVNGKLLASFEHAIEFRDVSFMYEDKLILKNINLTIEKGKTVALVGSSGAGKSTLADLVPRFHDVSSGQLLIDGIDIRDYSLESVRSQMGIVTQEPILFNDTILNNIALGMENVPSERVMHAAQVAHAHHYIMQKEEGYHTNIGDRGNKLSGGEKQRLTIARALLKNPPILILDEATSSLDTESERLVQDAINHMMQHRTSLVIAHRLSTIRHADEIIVLQHGEIAERGSHAGLMEQGGIYRRLVDMQEVR